MFSFVAFFAFQNASIAQETHQKKMYGVIVQINEQVRYFEIVEKIETILEDDSLEYYGMCAKTGNLVVLAYTHENALSIKKRLENAGFEIKLQDIE